MKCSRLSDEVYTPLAKSEVANSILRFCNSRNRAFHKVKVMIKSIQFMESNLNESDVKLSNLSKIAEDVVDRLSKVEHMCQTSIIIITSHSNTDLQITVRKFIDEEREMCKRKF